MLTRLGIASLEAIAVELNNRMRNSHMDDYQWQRIQATIESIQEDFNHWQHQRNQRKEIA